MELTKVLFLLFIGLQMLDIYSTRKALDKQGVYEANPIMRFLMNRMGVDAALVLVKVVGVAVFFYYLDSISPWVFIILNIIYAVVVYNNLRLAK